MIYIESQKNIFCHNETEVNKQLKKQKSLMGWEDVCSHFRLTFLGHVGVPAADGHIIWVNLRKVVRLSTFYELSIDIKNNTITKKTKEKGTI